MKPRVITREPLVISFSALFFALVSLLTPTSTMAAGRINLTPSPVTLQEGNTQLVTITLDEPIISPNGPGYVHIVITPADTNRVSLDTNEITIPVSQWAAPHTFTVTAVDDQTYNNNQSIPFTISVDSNSEYYNGFSPSFTLSVVDNDSPPAAAPVAVSSQTLPLEKLADTGGAQPIAAFIAFALFVVSFTALTYKKRLAK